MSIVLPCVIEVSLGTANLNVQSSFSNVTSARATLRTDRQLIRAKKKKKKKKKKVKKE